VQHIGAAVGAMVSSVILVERPGHGLGRMPLLASFSMVLAAALPFLLQTILQKAALAGRAPS
jgi:hypothetical protein